MNLRKNRYQNYGDSFWMNFRYRRKWKRITAVLSVFVMIGTVASLMLPAITLNQYDCGYDEHIHAADCYTLSLEVGMTCNPEVLDIHIHSGTCRDAENQIICGTADFLVHSHDAYCYDTNGSLICPLGENREHTHSEACYQTEEVQLDAGHIHSDDCYTWEIGEMPTCDQDESAGHQHGDSCYAVETELVCDLAESEAHVHGEGCLDEEGNLICPLEETEGHQHGEACWADSEILICATEVNEGHTHTDNCYELIPGELNCGEEERDPLFGPGEKELICGKREVILHTHKSTCYEYDGNGNPVSLICGKVEVKSHQHTDACFAEFEVKQLICQIPEHSHSEECEPVVVLTEEEQAQVDAAIIAIDGLPTIEEVNVLLSELEGLTDPGERELQTAALAERINPVCQQYDALTEQQKNAVTNASRLLALRALVPVASEPPLPEGETEPTQPQEETAPSLTEEEQAQLDTVIAAMEALPETEALSAELDAFTAEQDLAGWKEALKQVSEQVAAARELYDALPEDKREAVTNAEKLLALEAFVSEARIADLTDLEIHQIEDVNQLIEALPLYSDFLTEKERMEAEEDSEALAAYRDKVMGAAKYAISSYDELTQTQKPYVKAAEKLAPYRAWLIELGVLEVPVHSVVMYTDASCTEEADSTIAVTLAGLLPEGAKVQAFPAAAADSDADVLYACDFQILLRDGTLYQPESPVTVTVSGITAPDNAELVVWHFLDDGTVEEVPSQWDGGDTVSFTAEHFSVYGVVDIRPLYSIAEAGDPAAVQALVDSGFFSYWSGAAAQYEDPALSAANNYGVAPMALLDEGGANEPSDSQITKAGGVQSDGTVTVSKTIDGTDVENVFDITLKVDTTTNITELQKDPDMAVVIVMDISNTMNKSFGGSTRYKAAMLAAEDFLDKFAAANNGYSRVGYVAFNTDAHQIFGLSECSTTEQATALKNTMRTQTGNIINNYEKDSNGYVSDHRRFTNVEAGLKMGYDMLAGAPNANKYIIFLSDGFPTTYVKSGYTGYDPYCSSGTKGADGVFYDYVTGYYCVYGTSYSDKAAIRARNMATTIKNAGVNIFSIGIDVGGQTIAGYDGRNGLSVIDRTSTAYELGSATDTSAFKNWLRNSIGSGYYYDSTDTTGLQAAYDKIFEQIKTLTQEANALKWTASDPIPSELEFIGFYNNKGQLQVFEPITSLVGSSKEGAENMIAFDPENKVIMWNMKQSGYTVTGSGSSTTYHYTVTYRVRLRNELDGFVESQSYNTNGKTSLTYQNVTTVDGKETISGDKTVEFPIPAVRGYLGELTFKKVTNTGEPLKGAVFELRHDEAACPLCRGDGQIYVQAVEDKVFTATSGTDGIVTFTRIPSGHSYSLVETVVPAGYYTTGSTYAVTVAYDKVTVAETPVEGDVIYWDLENGTHALVNETGPELPATGGMGSFPYMFSGAGMMIASCALMYKTTRKKRKGSR